MSLHLGLDLGGTKLSAVALRPGFEGATDPQTHVAARARIPTEAGMGYAHVLGRCAKLLRRVFDEGGGIGRPVSLGVGAPGQVSRLTGGLKNANTSCLIGEDLRGDLGGKLGESLGGMTPIPLALDNDANLFTLAEATWGGGRGCRVVFGVILGTGVGGGIAVDGRPLSGLQGIAGEWGHNPLHPGGRPCYCGRRGCVETYLSGTGLGVSLTEAGISLEGPAFTRAVAEDPDALGPAGRAVRDAYLQDLGLALGVVVNLIDPDVILLGGGVGQWGTLYSEGPAALAPFVFNDELLTPLRRPRLGDDAGVFGAALLGAQGI